MHQSLVTLKIYADSSVVYVQDIRTCQGPRDELDDLNKKGRIKISDIKALLDKFQTLADEELDVNTKNTLLFEAKSFSDEHLATVAELSKATVRCMLSIDSKTRKELLTSNDGDLASHR